ncbi:MAG: dihydroorotate dehydrogenase electron transfer subunit [Candidatus Omnitrophica bacterium]|nr:dihydroorotate dehydrogenase electron transfer subunit [Candidatus Omnitrophota bacterium]MDD5027672.1 dihydroorotate dehydrogenase electron transfer subunit [Candidatus Omnitrophota bacterium]MDD5661594.1 dihydroorotate dehydrogenase electron transfer subunit [Candidatus Omnitrophota bacterium]
MKNFQLKAKILAQTRIKDNYWRCELSAPQIAKNALAGQFINIRVNDGLDPLLRRPLSIHGARGSKIKIFYKVVGKATEILAQKKVGEMLDILGPLGSGFTYPQPAARRSPPPILVAGGMGVAPLIFLAEKLRGVKTTVLIGAKTKGQLLCAWEFKKSGCAVKIATDDGSSGFKGRVSDLLKNLLSASGPSSQPIYACGPKPMLRAVADIANVCGIPAQLSLEEHMSCGIGACLGCVVRTKDGLKRVCKEGPVFLAKDLIW